MLSYTPIKITGAWRLGYALDVHVVHSVRIDDDQYGHVRFRNTYSPLGDHLHRLKYRGDTTAIPPIVECAADFLRQANNWYDLMIPVLPSSTRAIQPVILLATEIAKDYGNPLGHGLIQHTRPAKTLKNIQAAGRAAAIDGLYSVDPAAVEGADILLFDDLYQSGATMNEITKVLLAAGARMVDALTITKTR